MKSSSRTLGSIALGLLSTAALALAVATPASALASPVSGTRYCGAYHAYVTVVASNSGNWYSADKLAGSSGPLGNFRFHNGGSYSWFTTYQDAYWQAGSNISVTTFASASATCK